MSFLRVVSVVASPLLLVSAAINPDYILNAIYSQTGLRSGDSSSHNPWYSRIQHDLGKRLSPQGAIIFPDDNLWTNTTQRWSSVSFSERVIAAVEAGTAGDVKKTVQYALDNAIPFIIRNSGHGWTKSYNEEMKQDGIVISIRKLDNLTIDSEKNEMTVQAGVKNHQVIDGLFKARKRSTTGSCDCPSYIGILLGGGHGRHQSLYGLVSDNLITATVLLSSGEIVTASASSHPDLFWALRGAGHNFGFVLEVTARIYDPVDGDDWLVADYIYDSSPEKIFEVFTYIEGVRATQPVLLSIFPFLMSMNPSTPEKAQLRVSIQYGAKDLMTFDQLRKDFMAMKPSITQEVVVPWNDVGKAIGSGLGEGFCTMPSPKTGMFTLMLKNYNVTNIVDVWRLLEETKREMPSLRNSLIMFEGYPLKKFQEIPSESSAYPHRDMNILVAVAVQSDQTDGLDDRDFEALGEKGRDILMRGVEGGRRCYVNYAIGNEGKEAMYYGNEPWRKSRLDAAKAKWDPRGYFSNYNPVV